MYYHCAKDQIENRTPNVLISRLNIYFMTILTAVLFLKHRLLKIAKPPVLRICGNDNSKSRYGNDLTFVMAFLDR